MRIAVPITGSTPEQALQQIEKAATFGANIAELRLDFGLRDVKEVIKFSPLQTIVSCRPDWAYGQYLGSELERVRLFRNGLKAGADFIELQNEMAPRYLDYLLEKSKESSAVIIRTKHFEEMPTVNELVEARNETRADIGKIAPVANNHSEAVRALKALQKFDEWDGLSIFFARGSAGRITRFLSETYGSYLTYAYLDSPLAPGQIGIKELNKVKSLLKKVKLDTKHLIALEAKIDKRLK